MASSSVFTSIISPNELQIGDRVIIKGILEDNADEFSVNFVNEICENPSNITYHFQWILYEKIIVQNYREDGKSKCSMELGTNEFDGTIFELLFVFQDAVVLVYKMSNNSPNFIAKFDLVFDISEIKAIQVWGDVERITELTYKYEGGSI